MVYLSDPQAFAGGDTVFHDGPPDRRRPPRELARLKPPAGALIVFDRTLWHSGDRVTAGVKTILRCELLFHSPAVTMSSSGHRGYVFCLAPLVRCTFRNSRGGPVCGGCGSDEDVQRLYRSDPVAEVADACAATVSTAFRARLGWRARSNNSG